LKKIGIILSLVALTYISGAHLALVQGVAWGKMLVDYSKETGLVSGISKTFDGEHPCSMCKEVEKARKDHEPLVVVLKISDLKAASPFAETFSLIRYATDRPDYFSAASLSWGIAKPVPLLPPPRS
jgi:hypothetical protein